MSVQYRLNTDGAHPRITIGRAGSDLPHRVISIGEARMVYAMLVGDAARHELFADRRQKTHGADDPFVKAGLAAVSIYADNAVLLLHAIARSDLYEAQSKTPAPEPHGD